MVPFKYVCEKKTRETGVCEPDSWTMLMSTSGHDSSRRLANPLGLGKPGTLHSHSRRPSRMRIFSFSFRWFTFPLRLLRTQPAANDLFVLNISEPHARTRQTHALNFELLTHSRIHRLNASYMTSAIINNINIKRSNKFSRFNTIKTFE